MATMMMKKLLLFVSLIATLSQAKYLIVYLNEDPLIETRAFKGIHEEALMRRGLRGNSNERNAPLAEAISKNKELQLQEKRIKSQQEIFISSVPEQWKVAEFYKESGRKQKAVSKISSNSVVIDIGDSDEMDAMRKLMLIHGVKKVEKEQKIKTNTFQSLDQIGATPVYEAFGKEELEIGKGIKIAVTDNGNYVKNRMMDDSGFSLPVDIPSDRGEMENVNNKLIISKKFGDYEHSYQNATEDCHGIHTSSTAGGRRIAVDLYGNTYTISGVAPGAWLMNYRYVGTTNAFVNVLTDEIIGDNPDVSSNSWGPSVPILNSNHESFKQFDRMMDNGIFVSVAAGNEGPKQLTAGASVEKAIVVGACSKEDIAYYSLDVPAMGKTYECIASSRTAGLKDTYNLVAVNDGEETGCNSELGLSFQEGSAVLVINDDCEYPEKAANMKKYGAEIMIVGEAAAYKYATTDLPSVHCDYYTAVYELLNYVIANGTIPATLTRVREDLPSKDQVVPFSSRGPTQDMKLVPDVVAPGLNVLAAGYGDGEDPRVGFNFVSGTSMATPIVSGAAAVVLQKHPDFTTEEVKSALMTTADFIGVTRFEDGEPAQPLDMGAGRINLEKAVNPTLYISPPKVDFSLAQKPNKHSKTLKVHSYSDEELTVSVRIVYHTGYNQVTPAESYLSADPSEFTLSADKKDVNVTFSLDTSKAEPGDENAYVLFENKATGEEVAHVPLWGLVTCAESEKKDVLLFVIDTDDCSVPTASSVAEVYKSALRDSGLSYDVADYCDDETSWVYLQNAVGLGYRAIIFAVNKNVVSNVFVPMEGEIRRMMHAGVTIIQMGRTIPYTWYGCDYALDYEFGIDTENTIFNFVPAVSEYLESDVEVLDNIEFNLYNINLYETTDGKPIVVSIKDISGDVETKTMNSVGITSIVGLEQFKEKYRKEVILKSFWNGMEKGSDIKVESSFNENVVKYNASTLLENSDVVQVEFDCGDGSEYGLVEGSSFTCKYDKIGEYNVVYMVYTSVGNEYVFYDDVSVTEISLGSSYSLPSLMLMVLFAVLFML